jgi:hypothetical protein
LVYNHNLVKDYVECDYTHSSHNSLVSQKIVFIECMIIEGVYYVGIEIRRICVNVCMYQFCAGVGIHINLHI